MVDTFRVWNMRHCIMMHDMKPVNPCQAIGDSTHLRGLRRGIGGTPCTLREEKTTQQIESMSY